MVLGKIKDMVTGKNKEKDSSLGNRRNIKEVTNLDDETEYDKSPVSTRNKRKDLSLPSEEEFAGRGRTPRDNNPRNRQPSPRRSREKPAPTREPDNRANNPTSRRPSPEPPIPRRRVNERNEQPPVRNSQESNETKEMLREILRKLDIIDRRLQRPQRR